LTTNACAVNLHYDPANAHITFRVPEQEERGLLSSEARSAGQTEPRESLIDFILEWSALADEEAAKPAPEMPRQVAAPLPPPPPFGLVPDSGVNSVELTPTETAQALVAELQPDEGFAAQAPQAPTENVEAEPFRQQDPGLVAEERATPRNYGELPTTTGDVERACVGVFAGQSANTRVVATAAGVSFLHIGEHLPAGTSALAEFALPPGFYRKWSGKPADAKLRAYAESSECDLGALVKVRPLPLDSIGRGRAELAQPTSSDPAALVRQLVDPNMIRVSSYHQLMDKARCGGLGNAEWQQFLAVDILRCCEKGDFDQLWYALAELQRCVG
jgi:hypothetical protein